MVWTSTVLLLASLALAGCGRDEPDPAAVTRTCNDARNACVQACSSGGNYVPEPCKAACEKGQQTCTAAADARCDAFRSGCNDGCDNDRCQAACDAGYEGCPDA
jgi:hypothetical protein